MRVLKYTLYSLAGAVGVYLLSFGILYLAGYRVYKVPSMGMRPTIRQGERVVGRLSESYRGHIERFDLAIFIAPKPLGQIIVKRVVGLPGEHIVINEAGIRINGNRLELPPTVDLVGLALKKCDTQVPADSVFVLGDFTKDSFDSRYFGPVVRSAVLGYLVFKR